MQVSLTLKSLWLMKTSKENSCFADLEDIGPKETLSSLAIITN